LFLFVPALSTFPFLFADGTTKDKNGIEKKGSLLLKALTFALYFLNYLTVRILDQNIS